MAPAVCYNTNEGVYLCVKVRQPIHVSTSVGKGGRRRMRLLPIRQIYGGQQNLSDLCRVLYYVVLSHDS